MLDLTGKVSLGIGLVALFFAFIKSEFLLWDVSALLSKADYNPIPFAIAAIFFIAFGVYDLKASHGKRRKKQAARS